MRIKNNRLRQKASVHADDTRRSILLREQLCENIDYL